MSTSYSSDSFEATREPGAINGAAQLAGRPIAAIDAAASLYDEDYYERGVEKGISGYSNYRWIPELTIPMAMTIIDSLDVRAGARVLDFGCAKGFTVKALRMLRRDAKGVDISSYAVGQAPPDVAGHCHLVEDAGALGEMGRFDYVLAKDVLEHVPHQRMEWTLESISSVSDVLMAIIPLGVACGPRRYVIEAYERDITHVVREPAQWWEQQLRIHWRDVTWRHHVRGIKDNWHAVHPQGNAVFIARGSRAA